MRWQAAEQEVEARLAEFKGGRSPVNVVLQSQLRRADAQIAYYRALGEYNKSINYVDYLKGTMLANSNITLAEGPWNSKAYWDALERARERSAGKHKKYGVTRPGVVRRGPLLDPTTAAGVIGSGIEHAPSDWSDEGVILDGAATELELDIDNGAIDVEDVPLEAMGKTTGEMLQPRDLVNGDASPRVMTDEESLPVPESLRGPIGSGAGSLSQPPDPNAGVIPISYQSQVETRNAPEPVRRTPLPNRTTQ